MLANEKLLTYGSENDKTGQENLLVNWTLSYFVVHKRISKSKTYSLNNIISENFSFIFENGVLCVSLM